MKKLIIVFLALSMFSCKSKEDKTPKAEAEKKITQRDLSITPQNSYSDLFLDSLALEKFIVDNNINDTITR